MNRKQTKQQTGFSSFYSAFTSSRNNSMNGFNSSSSSSQQQTRDGEKNIIKDFSSFIQNSLKDLSIPFRAQEYDYSKDKILWTSFEYFEINGHRKLFLVLTYTNGFQIWDMTDPDNPEAFVSRHEVAIKLVKFLPNPPQDSKNEDRFKDARPLVAVAAAEEGVNFPKSAIKIYSLKTHEYVHMLKFDKDAEIYQILSSGNLLVIGLKDKIFGFDQSRMVELFNLPCYPNTGPYGIMAMGPRWLAYPGNQPLPINSSTIVQSTANQSLTEKSLDVAKNITSGIYYLGDLGVKKLSTYMNPELAEERAAQSAANNNEEKNVDNTYAGTVIVRDVKDSKIIAQFRAHLQPLSALAFDPSGTLLVTASVEGNYLNVYQIMPSQCRHLYKLYRGLTSATIQDIRFSINSRWVAVSSAHGTTHIYAINPNGGPVNSQTHTVNSLHLGASPEMNFYMEAIGKKIEEPITLSVCNRIRQNYFISSSEVNPKAFFPLPIATTFLDYPRKMREQLFILTSNGTLTNYHMEPKDSEQEPGTLVLDIEEVDHKDVCRSVHDEDIQKPLTNKEAERNDEQEKQPMNLKDERSKWIANVEIETYTPPIIPLWISGQFKFKILQTTNEEADAPVATEGVIPARNLTTEDLAKSVEIRRTNPIPVKETIGFDGSSDFDLMRSVVLLPSAPPMAMDTEHDLGGSITRAISTPLQHPVPERGMYPDMTMMDMRFQRLRDPYHQPEGWEMISAETEFMRQPYAAPIDHRNVSFVTSAGIQVKPTTVEDSSMRVATPTPSANNNTAKASAQATSTVVVTEAPLSRVNHKDDFFGNKAPEVAQHQQQQQQQLTTQKQGATPAKSSFTTTGEAEHDDDIEESASVFSNSLKSPVDPFKALSASSSSSKNSNSSASAGSPFNLTIVDDYYGSRARSSSVTSNATSGSGTSAKTGVVSGLSAMMSNLMVPDDEESKTPKITLPNITDMGLTDFQLSDGFSSSSPYHANNKNSNNNNNNNCSNVAEDFIGRPIKPPTSTSSSAVGNKLTDNYFHDFYGSTNKTTNPSNPGTSPAEIRDYFLSKSNSNDSGADDDDENSAPASVAAGSPNFLDLIAQADRYIGTANLEESMPAPDAASSDPTRMPNPQQRDNDVGEEEEKEESPDDFSDVDDADLDQLNTKMEALHDDEEEDGGGMSS